MSENLIYHIGGGVIPHSRPRSPLLMSPFPSVCCHSPQSSHEKPAINSPVSLEDSLMATVAVRSFDDGQYPTSVCARRTLLLATIREQTRPSRYTSITVIVINHPYIDRFPILPGDFDSTSMLPFSVNFLETPQVSGFPRIFRFLAEGLNEHVLTVSLQPNAIRPIGPGFLLANPSASAVDITEECVMIPSPPPIKNVFLSCPRNGGRRGCSM